MPPTATPSRSRSPTAKRKYRLYAGVALLDEHVLRDDDGSIDFVVDARFLSDVARRANERAKQTGDLTPVVIGHTRDGLAEEEQPEIVGYAKNFRVDKFARTGKKAVFADLYIYSDRADAIERKYPRRSVELWVKRREIDPISLLGATTPERDLGPLVKYSRGGDTLYRYSLTGVPVDDELKDAEMGEMSSIKALEAKVDKLASMFEQFLEMVMGEAEPEAEDDDLLGPDPEAEGDAMDAPEADPEAAPEEPEMAAAKFNEPPPVKMQATPSVGANRIPSTAQAKMSRETTPELIKLQRQSAAQEKELANLKLKLSRTEAEKAIRDLKDVGVEFADEAEDVEILAHLGVATREGKKHIERMKRNYRRSVVGQTEDALLDSALESTRPLTSAEAKELAARAASGEIDYKEVLKKRIG